MRSPDFSSPRAKWLPRVLVIMITTALALHPSGLPILLLWFIARAIHYQFFVLPKSLPPTPLRATHKHLAARDGTIIHYYYVGEDNTGGSKTIILANGVGCIMAYWRPIIDHFVAEGYRFVGWDQRGQFGSGKTAPELISIETFASDCEEIMNDMGMEQCAVLLGWSTGVQVGLEFASRHPHRVSNLVLVNGNHSNTFNTLFQPFIRIPYVSTLMQNICKEMPKFAGRKRVQFLDGFLSLYRPYLHILFSRVWAILYLSPPIEIGALTYVGALLGTSRDHFVTYWKVVQALKDHRAYESLPNIHTPTTLISGGLDFLTPCWQMYEMESLMPNARHINLLFNTHAIILEAPDVIRDAIENCLRGVDGGKSESDNQELVGDAAAA